MKEVNEYIFANKKYLPLKHRIFLSMIIFGILVCILSSTVAILFLASNSLVIIGI